MTDIIIKTIITSVTSGVLGYCISVIKHYKQTKEKILDEFKELKESQLCDMRSDLSNKFYIYDSMEEVDDYLYLAWMEKLNRYYLLGGNNYLHRLEEKSKNWKIRQTQYLK